MATLTASYNDNNSLTWLKGTTSSKNNTGVEYTITASDFNSYVDANIPDYSYISSAVLYFAATKSESLSNGSINITVNGDNVYSKSNKVLASTPLEDNIDIIDYINSGVIDAGKINGNIVFKITSSTSLISAQWIIKNLSITWTYTHPIYNVSLIQTTGGTISQSGTGTYDVDSSATLTATPISGYRFVQWSDGNTDASRILTVTTNDISSNVTNLTYSAVFEKIYTLTVNVNDISMANIEMYRNGDVVSGNSVEYSVNDIANFKASANKGYILSSVSISNNTSSNITTITADEAHNEGYLDDAYMVFSWDDMVISESMLGMEATINFEFIAGSKIYTLTITANDSDLGDIVLYKNDTKVEGSIFEGVTGDKFIITATANDDSFVYSVSDETTILDKNTLISYTFLDNTCKQFNLPIEVKESYIGNEETFTINFTPGINMYFAGKKAIELYYEGNLFSAAYFEGNKL